MHSARFRNRLFALIKFPYQEGLMWPFDVIVKSISAFVVAFGFNGLGMDQQIKLT